MPIEFSCPACRHWVGTPDAAAGKHGRCPNCKAIVPVPLASEVRLAAQPAAQPAYLDLACPACKNLVRTPASAAGKHGRCPSCKAIFAIPAQVPAAAGQPAAPASVTSGPDLRDPWLDLPPAARLGQATANMPQLGKPVEPPPAKPEEPPPAWVQVLEKARQEQDARGGLAWERDSSLENLVDTTFQLCSSGGRDFDQMNLRGGFSNPLSFYILAFLVYHLVSIGLSTGMFIFVQWRDEALNQVDWLALFQAFCLQLVLSIVSSTVLGLVSSLVASGFMHLVLLVLGGAQGGFEATMRVICYSGGACAILGATIVLAPITPVFGLLLPIVGLHRVHKVSVWKSALAVCLGLFTTVVIIILLVWIAIVLIVASLISHWGLGEFFGRGG